MTISPAKLQDYDADFKKKWFMSSAIGIWFLLSYGGKFYDVEMPNKSISISKKQGAPLSGNVGKNVFISDI